MGKKAQARLLLAVAATRAAKIVALVGIGIGTLTTNSRRVGNEASGGSKEYTNDYYSSVVPITEQRRRMRAFACSRQRGILRCFSCCSCPERSLSKKKE